MDIVKCFNCGDLWSTAELGTVEVAINNEDDSAEVMKCKVCPNCKNAGWLEAVDDSFCFSQDDLKSLWRCFGDAFVNENDETEEEFLCFPAGTFREDIWHWFDEKYEGGLMKMLDDIDKDEEGV